MDKTSSSDASVPTNILRAIETDRKRHAAFLADRDTIVSKVAEAEKARVQAKKSWARSDAAKDLRTPTQGDFSAVAKALRSHLEATAGPETWFLTPSDVPLSPTADPFGVSPEDAGTQHGLIETHIGTNKVRDYVLIAFLVPTFFKPWAMFELEEDSNERVFTFDFSGSSVPNDGLYLVRSSVVVYGKTGLYRDAGGQNSAVASVVAGIADAYESSAYSGNVMSRLGTDTNTISDFWESAVLSRLLKLYAGAPLGFKVLIKARTSAKGDNSTAVINMLNGVGGAACVATSIEYLSPLN